MTNYIDAQGLGFESAQTLAWELVTAMRREGHRDERIVSELRRCAAQDSTEALCNSGAFPWWRDTQLAHYQAGSEKGWLLVADAVEGP